MIMFASILAPAAILAGIKVPDEDDQFECFEYFRESHPHWYVFCATQLDRSVVYHGEHWDNAKVIAKISSKNIKKITLDQLIEMGYSHP